MSLKDDLKIDVQNLDIEWAMLPELHHLYNSEATALESRIKKMKLKLSTQNAQMSREIRKNQDQYLEDGERMTVALIQSLVEGSEEYRELTDRIIDLETKRKIILGTVEDLDIKRTSLTNLTKLFMSEFYSVPTTEKEMTKYDKAYGKIEDTPVMTKVLERLNNKRKSKEKQNG
jgi:hypothetical protein